MKRAGTAKPAWHELKCKPCCLFTSESLALWSGEHFPTERDCEDSTWQWPCPPFLRLHCCLLWLFPITADPHHPRLAQSLGNSLPLRSHGWWGFRMLPAWTTLCMCLKKGPGVWAFQAQGRAEMGSGPSPDAQFKACRDLIRQLPHHSRARSRQPRGQLIYEALWLLALVLCGVGGKLPLLRPAGRGAEFLTILLHLPYPMLDLSMPHISLSGKEEDVSEKSVACEKLPNQGTWSFGFPRNLSVARYACYGLSLHHLAP